MIGLLFYGADRRNGRRFPPEKIINRVGLTRNRNRSRERRASPEPARVDFGVERPPEPQWYVCFSALPPFRLSQRLRSTQNGVISVFEGLS
ncbi:hypothetical protein BT93_L1251 [Corymbia citriodora subsp. variegata]|uniref:Uncharacterized protein n=1 Tax=Corymbia citriodora subsp. variegata TaxID=360336 RepID=A0A8T0CNA1_CORYI|nr:hypothetical protein BT93_L1251 [Corymbia citriodora subsp. variegata]